MNTYAPKKGLKKLKNDSPLPIPMHPTDDTKQPPDARQVQIYAPKRGWLMPLKVSILLSVFLPMPVTILLLVYSESSGNAAFWVSAAFGTLLSEIGVIFLIIPKLAFCQSENILLVRDGSGLLWKVLLMQLNATPAYHFTRKGALRGLRWDYLSAEEQVQAKSTICRAIADLESGDGFGTANLWQIVVPLSDLALIKEDRRQWKLSYAVQEGRKLLSIPKVYENLRPVPGAEIPVGPPPFFWRELATVALCMLLFGGIGGVFWLFKK